MKKAVECLCVVASAGGWEANGLLTVLRWREEAADGQGWCWERDFILSVNLSRQKERGPSGASETRAVAVGAWGGEQGPGSAAALAPRCRGVLKPGHGGSAPPALIPHSAAGGKAGRKRKHGLCATAGLKGWCCWHRYGEVIASSALLHVRFHLLPQLFPQAESRHLQGNGKVLQAPSLSVTDLTVGDCALTACYSFCF